MKGLTGFANGIGAFARALKLLFAHPRFLPLVILPSMLTAALFALLAWWAIEGFESWSEAFFAGKDAWYWTWTGARYFAWVVFIATLLIIGFFTFVAAGTVICAPFNEWLSRGLERILVPGAEAPGGGWRGAVQEVALAIAHALMRVALLAVLLIAALPLQWVPILGQAVLVLIAAQFLALEGLDPCLARRRLSFREKWRFIGSHRSRTLGLGTAAYLLLLVPFTALVVLPLLAAAGTVLWCEIEGERRRAAGERAG